ncbi:MAG: LamG domain-containing protein [Bacteriovoracaceae bacterium]|jgi:hypothetical protein|nr:LamG domain-containing protein [Bacteriovoracaceae bacterium]
MHTRFSKFFFLLFVLIFSLSCGRNNQEEDSGSTQNPISENGNSEVGGNHACPDGNTTEVEFRGLQSIDQIETNSIRLNWNQTSDVAQFNIFKAISTTDLEFVRSVGGSRKNILIKSLTPATTYEYVVRIMDSEGKHECNNIKVQATTSATPVFSNSQSFEFTGTEHIGLGNGRNLIPNNKFTLSFWFKTTQQQNDKRIINFHKNPLTAGTAVNIHFKNTGVAIGYRDELDAYQTYSHTTNYYDGNWHHIALAYNQTRFKLYYDGVLAVNRVDSFIGIGAFSAFIGTYSGTDRFIKGNLDEVSIWKTTLNKTAIEEIYGTGVPTDLQIHSKNGSIVSWYRFESPDDKDSVSDSIGSNDGTPSAATNGNFSTDVP